MWLKSGLLEILLEVIEKKGFNCGYVMGEEYWDLNYERVREMVLERVVVYNYMLYYFSLCYNFYGWCLVEVFSVYSVVIYDGFRVGVVYVGFVFIYSFGGYCRMVFMVS